MQTIRLCLHELDSSRHDTVAHPMRWSRHSRRIKTLCIISQALLQRQAIRKKFALKRSPGAKLTHLWPRPKILVRILVRYFFDISLNANLSSKAVPVKCECRPRILSEIAALSGEGIRVEHKSA